MTEGEPTVRPPRGEGPVPLRVVIVTTRARCSQARHTASTAAAALAGWGHDGATAAVRVAVVDGPPDGAGAAGGSPGPGGVTVEVAPVQVASAPGRPGGDRREAHRLRLLHPADDLVTLLRPRQVQAALAEVPGGVVVLLPDDAVVVSSLEPLISALMSDVHEVLLSPVRTSPLPRDGRMPDDVVLLGVGAVEPGLLAVRSGPGADAWLRWWAAALDRHRLLEPDRLDPLGVTWLDRAPALFPGVVAILDRPVARWSANADDPSSPGAPVVRLPGFDPARPWLLEPSLGPWPRALSSEHPDLAAAADARSRALLREAGPGTSADVDGPDRLPNGMAVTAVMRRLYRDALHHAERHGTPEPPNPFAPGELIDAVTAWAAPSSPGSAVTVYLRALADDRPDLRAVDDGALIAWARHHGTAEGHPPRLLGILMPSGAATVATPEGTPVTPGLTVVGLVRAEFGMGEAARRTLETVRQARTPVSLVVDDGATQRQAHDPGWDGPVGLLHDVQVVVANADAIAGVVGRLDLDAPRRRGEPVHRVGVWFWEVDRFPAERFRAGIAAVDEVWTASTFCRDVLADALDGTGVEVHRLPWPVVPCLAGGDERAAARSRVAAELGVPAGRTCFLFSFDHRSVAERKNPWGAVEAFRRAFPRPTAHGPLLVLKSISAGLDPTGRDHLRWCTRDRDDIVLVEDTLDGPLLDALVVRADAYVSLHRSEGYGLTIAEAIARGTPVVATAWSGSADLMDPATTWPVPAELVEVPADVPVYGGFGARWGDPDLGAAAAAMSEIADDPVAARARAAGAAAALAAAEPPDAGARMVISRLRALRARRSPSRPITTRRIV
jgi:glycosyltransferase involved in cell wall biosynthesis